MKILRLKNEWNETVEFPIPKHIPPEGAVVKARVRIGDVILSDWQEPITLMIPPESPATTDFIEEVDDDRVRMDGVGLNYSKRITPDDYSDKPNSHSGRKALLFMLFIFLVGSSFGLFFLAHWLHL
jgi:hypothetical protein